MAEIVTDGDYRFAPDGPGDEIIGCPECRIPPDEPGSFLYDGGSDPYKAPPSYFLVRGDPLSPGSESSPGFVTVATYGDLPTAVPRQDRTAGPTFCAGAALSASTNPSSASR